MSAIKPGDLVMSIIPLQCCGFVPHQMGVPFTAGITLTGNGICPVCGYLHKDNLLTQVAESGETESWVQTYRLKKIDPPETGDSLPTRADLNLPEPACP